MPSILVANNHLQKIGGSETFTYTLISKLIEKGYNVEYFTFFKGITSTKIEKDLNVRFMSKKKYDVIFANHNTCVNYLYSKGKIIQTCHGIFPKSEQPSKYADRHVAISQEVMDHLTNKGFKSKLILNGIDCNRFFSNHSINSSLKNILSLSQSESANKMIRTACEKMGIQLHILNKHINATWNVEQIINKVDLVIGLGRSAYEAMACGRPVVIFDNREYSESFADGYVTEKNISNFIINNCSGRFSKKKFNSDELENEFLQYNAKDGEFLREYALENLNIDLQIVKYFELAEEIQNFRSLRHLKLKIDDFFLSTLNLLYLIVKGPFWFNRFNRRTITFKEYLQIILKCYNSNIKLDIHEIKDFISQFDKNKKQ
ncbi:glycosyltransferase family protein [Flavicella marina]|uniref:glycosyltransferase n=1 Tax=Flavicella marina TaxID=1475951 RepID=UPI001265538A|nr:glycosyltransferase [Flavicella marina]